MACIFNHFIYRPIFINCIDPQTNKLETYTSPSLIHMDNERREKNSISELGKSKLSILIRKALNAKEAIAFLFPLYCSVQINCMCE